MTLVWVPSRSPLHTWLCILIRTQTLIYRNIHILYLATVWDHTLSLETRKIFKTYLWYGIFGLHDSSQHTVCWQNPTFNSLSLYQSLRYSTFYVLYWIYSFSCLILNCTTMYLKLNLDGVSHKMSRVDYLNI